MKRIIYFLAFTLVSLTSIAAGIDFSGTWNLNKSKSTLGDQFSMAPTQLVLTQAAESLVIERHSTFQDQNFTFTDKLTLDGKECINDGWQDTKKKSTAVWSAEGKILTITSKIPMQDGAEMTITETYQMEGTNLKVIASASSSYGDMSETFLFDKQ
jgi:hypothetical protein